MCGIAGIVSYREPGSRVDRAQLLAVREAMAKRGPDGAGDWISPDGRTGLAHRRLAIIDLSDTGRQPMSSADGRFHVTYNGEIYNYRELRADLAAEGERLRTASDTEVLLLLYARHGADMVRRLRGMFAFAIWDDVEKRLFLARDPFGVKPLYYADDGRTLRFASQVKALVAGGAIDTAPEPAGHVGFFVLGSVPEPFTLYRGIRALEAGHTLLLGRDGAPRVDRYFDVTAEFASAGERPASFEPGEAAELLRHALRDSVRHHMVADVPVGVFLSSGLDSSTVTALASELAPDTLRSVTLGFEEYRGTNDDEVPLAARTAAHLATAHSSTWVPRDAFEGELDRLLQAMDQPSIDGVNTYFVSKVAAENGIKVALSGLGGDELFGGYPSFRDVPRLARWFGFATRAPWLGRGVRAITSPLLPSVVSPKFASLFELGGTYPGAYLLRRALYLPWELRDFLDPALLREGWERLDILARLERTVHGIGSDRQRVAALELSWYMRNQLLRDADWAGMAHSVEIRVPFVDSRLFRSIAPLLSTSSPPSKVDAARVASRALPSALFARRKTGFSIPVHEWAKRTRMAPGRPRGLRNWAHIVHRPYKPLRALGFVPDAFGGHGGIALYNRDFLSALCAHPGVGRVVALPRLVTQRLEPMPAKLSFRTEAANSKLRYLVESVRLLLQASPHDLVFCSHINLLPLAVLAKWRYRAPLILFIYGIDAWKPQPRLRRTLLRHVDRFVSISEVTRRKFQEWSGIAAERITILPNAIHVEWYGAGPRNAALIERYRLEGKVVLMTLGRLVSSERYKGFDEVIDAMPDLVGEDPALVYLIAGDGSDRDRLQDKVRRLGLEHHVRFTGMVDEAEKADHFRLADAYVMPSRGEGFGFVLLEALACGIPVVASKADGGREAIRNGELGILVEPGDRDDVKRGIRAALRMARGSVPPGLEAFSFDRFRNKVGDVLREVTQSPLRARDESAVEPYSTASRNHAP